MVCACTGGTREVRDLGAQAARVEIKSRQTVPSPVSDSECLAFEIAGALREKFAVRRPEEGKRSANGHSVSGLYGLLHRLGDRCRRQAAVEGGGAARPRRPPRRGGGTLGGSLGDSHPLRETRPHWLQVQGGVFGKCLECVVYLEGRGCAEDSSARETSWLSD